MSFGSHDRPYAREFMITRIKGFTSYPLATRSFASASSNSGCVAGFVGRALDDPRFRAEVGVGLASGAL